MAEMSRFEKWFVNRRGARSYRRMLDRMERAGQLPIGNSSQVLELGAGNGALSMLILERFHPARIWVTDYDPEQVALARQNFSDHFGNIPSTCVVEPADGTRLGHPDHSLDLVLAHQVLHHFGGVPAILRGLDEIARVLRPGGRLLYVEMFHKGPIREHLVARGFTFAFVGRSWRLFNTADTMIAVAPHAEPPGN